MSVIFVSRLNQALSERAVHNSTHDFALKELFKDKVLRVILNTSGYLVDQSLIIDDAAVNNWTNPA